MKKFLLTLLVLSAFIAVKAQVIKPQQYNILIERTITHYEEYNCYKYEYSYFPGYVPDAIHCFDPPPPGLPDGESYCYVEDPNCYWQQWLPDRLTFKLFKGGNLQTGTGVEDIYMASQVPRALLKHFMIPSVYTSLNSILPTYNWI